MFFYASKMLSFVLSPLTWVFGLLLAAVVVRKERRSGKLLIAATVVLYLCSNSFLVDECYRAWEPVTEDHDLLDTKYDGAIILGGLGNVDLRLKKINFSMSADRLFQVLPLYYNKRVRRIIFTGGSGSIEFPEKREGIYVKSYLNAIGIPDSSLIIESTSKNTRENALNTRKILDSLSIKGNYLLVTSGFHMRRAMAVFKKAGFTSITPYVTNRSSGVRRFTADHLLIPNSGALFGLEALLHEWVGMLVYKLRGYA
jgi:uncharacterized SAM-binding protein YcdF (DUF218 family)